MRPITSADTPAANRGPRVIRFSPMQNQKRKLYRRTYYPLIVPEDNGIPLRRSSSLTPFGEWMTGVENLPMGERCSCNDGHTSGRENGGPPRVGRVRNSGAQGEGQRTLEATGLLRYQRRSDGGPYSWKRISRSDDSTQRSITPWLSQPIQTFQSRRAQPPSQ